MKKRIVSIITSLALCLSLLPAVSIPAEAAETDTGKAIQLGASQIEGGQADSIYFGTYQQSSDGSGGYHTDPIKWRVLSNADGKLFLLSDQNLDVKPYNTTYQDYTGAWAGSSLRSWLNGTESGNFYADAFEEKEQTAIAQTTVKNADGNKYDPEISAGEDTTDKVFALSEVEAETTAYGFTDNYKATDTRKATNTDYTISRGVWRPTGYDTSTWWLRSPGKSDDYAATVNYSGYLFDIGGAVSYKDIGVRPAFNLDLSSVLFTSAADNSGHNSSFAAPTGYSGSEWKVTLKDGNDFSSGASISGSTTLVAGYSDTTLTVSHAALDSFTNAGYTNVTAALTSSSGELLYYGSLNSDPSATSSTVTIPAGLAVGEYTLSVYGEDWNGEKLTDYATGTPFSTSIEVHAHNYQYAPPGYGRPYFEEACSCGHSAAANVNPPTLPSYYDGNPKTVTVTFSDNWVGEKNVTIEYEGVNYPKSTTAPTDAGTYTASITVNGETYSGANSTFTIGKADATDKTTSGETKYGSYGFVELYDLLAEGWEVGNITTTDADSVLNSAYPPSLDEHGLLTFNFVNDVGKVGETATITVPVTSSTNYNPYDIVVTVTVLEKWRQTIFFIEDTVTKTYGDEPFTIIAYPTAGGGDKTYTSSNPDAAEVDPATGEVTIKKADAMPVTITATAAATDDYFEATASYSLKINQKPLTVQPKAFTVKVNAAVPTFELAYDGLVSGESLTPSPAPEFKLYKSDGTTEITAEEAVKTVGTYIIKWTNMNDITAFTGGYENNYDFTTKDTASLVVERSGGGGGYIPPKPQNQPETGSSGGWNEIQDELTDLVDAIDSGTAKPGETVTVEMNGATEVPAEVLSEIAGKDVNVEFDMGGGVVWAVNGQDIPADMGDLNLGVETGGNSIPVNVINTITDETAAMQLELSHDGPFGTTLHLSLALGKENRGYWANLYYYDGKDLHFQHASRIDDKGRASWPFDHASSYAVIIDNENHDPEWVNPFTDVKETDWFYEAVAYVNKNGLMAGTSTAENQFSPDGITTRAQIVTILHRLEGEPICGQGKSGTFGDVPDYQWYTEAVEWAAAYGIVEGYGDAQQSFGPNDPITREQLATILYRYEQYRGGGFTGAWMFLLDHTDRDKVSDWAYEAMCWTTMHGVVDGKPGKILDPKGSAKRCEAAQMLMNYLER